MKFSGGPEIEEFGHPSFLEKPRRLSSIFTRDSRTTTEDTLVSGLAYQARRTDSVKHFILPVVTLVAVFAVATALVSRAEGPRELV